MAENLGYRSEAGDAELLTAVVAKVNFIHHDGCTKIRYTYTYRSIWYVISGKGGWFLIFIVQFFFLIEFHCTFSLSYKTMPYCFIIIVLSLGSDRPSGFFFSTASLLTFFVCFFNLFHSCCSHARVFGQTLVHDFPFPTAIFNGTWCFCLLVQDKINMP